MNLPALPENILRLIMEVSPQSTVATMTRTCRKLRAGGVRILLDGGVSLLTGEDILAFVLFLNADPDHRFKHFRSLELPNGRCPVQLADALLGIFSHPSLVLDSLTLRNAESFLCSTPTPSKSSPSLGHPDQAPFVSAFAGLTTLRHLTLEQCGKRACCLLATIRSPLKSVHVGFPAYSFKRVLVAEDRSDRNPILLLRNVSDSLEELSGANFGEPFDLTDLAPPIYPSVRKLSIMICKGGLRSFPIRDAVSYITAFPGLTHLSLISENSDGSLMGCLDSTSSFVDNKYGSGCGWENKEQQEKHGRTWTHLEEVSGGLNEVRALGLACHVPCLRLTGGIWSDTLEHVPDILEDTRPTSLAITILGASAFRGDAAAAVFRDPWAQQIQALDITLCFSSSEKGVVNIKAVVKNVIRSLGSLPALRNVVLTLNCGLVCAPTEVYRERWGWYTRTERSVDELDLEACATIFRRAIPTLVDVVVRCSKYHTSRDSEALYGPDWELSN